MSAHTPGPWNREGREVFVDDTEPNARGEKRERMLVQVKTVSHAPREELVADAMLIAAAPDLLAACESARKWLCEYAIDGDPDRAGADIIEELGAAIAKAKGADQ